nr:hypothetical protein [Tanacetum cinerariifolium]
KKGDSASSTTPPTPTPTTTVESAPRLFATIKEKQPSRATTPVEPTDVQRTEAEQLKIELKRSRQETHISQQSGSEQEEEESFDPIPRTPEESEEESNDEEEQDLRLSEEARIHKEEDADELYRDVNINQGMSLQVTQNVKDTHVTLTPYMTQQMKEAVREAVQIQTDRLQDSLQRENDEFLRNIDENMKKVLKGLVKN